MHVSYAEMARNAPEVLRMLGVSYSQADDAVEGFLLTHAALGVGYELLALTDGADKDRWSPPAISGEGEARHVDLGGQSLLLFAARLGDFAAATAGREGGHCRIVVTNAIGGWMAPYICFRLAAMGCRACVGWVPDEGAPTDAPPLNVTAAPAPGGRAEDVVCRLDEGERRQGISHGLRGALLIEAWRGPAPEGANSEGAGQAKGRELRMMQALAGFIEEGREVDQATHARFAAIQWRMRVAPSERSRGQAG